MGRKKAGRQVWKNLDVCRSKGKLRNLLSVPAAPRAAQTSPVPLNFSVHTASSWQRNEAIFSLQVEEKWLKIFIYTIPVVSKDPGLQRLWSLLDLFLSILPPVTTSPLGLGCAGGAGKPGQPQVTPGTTSPRHWREAGSPQIPKELAILANWPIGWM